MEFNDEMREEYYNDLIQEYDHLSHETITDMVDVGMMIHWMNDGNVERYLYRTDYTVEERIYYGRVGKILYERVY